jgi:hypothetical protein
MDQAFKEGYAPPLSCVCIVSPKGHVMSTRDVQLSEIAGLLKPHVTLPRTGCPDEQEIADAEADIGFSLPVEYRLFSKSIGSIAWPYSIVDAVECVDLLEDLNVPKSFAPFGELELAIAGFRPDSPHVWLWDGDRLQNTGESFFGWLKGLIVETRDREIREAREAREAAEPAPAKAARSEAKPAKVPRSSAPASQAPKPRTSRMPADAPKRLKQLVGLIRKARRFEAFDGGQGRWGVRVPEEGGVRTSYVSEEELGQLEAWSGFRAVRKP